MEKVNNKNGFLITCVSCIVLLLAMCYFGVSSSSILKGTAAASTCASGTLVGSYCCPLGYTAGVTSSGLCYSYNYKANSSGSGYCQVTTGYAGTATFEAAGWSCYENASTGGATYLCDSPAGVVDYCTKSNVGTPSTGYTATFTGVGTVSCTEDSDGNCYLNAPTTEPTKTGYEFTGWTGPNGPGCSDAIQPGTKINLGSDVTYTACWESLETCWQCNSPSNIYYWGATSSGGSSSCQSGWHVLTGRTEATCVTEQCWFCEGTWKWQAGQNGCQYPDTAVSSSVTCDAKNSSSSSSSSSTTNTVYVSYNANGGTIVDNRSGGLDVCDGGTTCFRADSCTINSGSTSCKATINISAERSGYNFKGWALSTTATSGVTGWTYISSNTTMYAVWEECESCSPSSSSTSNPTSSPSTSNPTSRPSTSTPTSRPSTSTPTSRPSTSIPTLPSWPNIEENPQTGQIAIFIVWAIALAAIVYSVWYFRKIKNN